VDSGNDYIGALKGNQSGLLQDVEANFQPEQTDLQINKVMVELKNVLLVSASIKVNVIGQD
jgi:hypothetical protein